ncbi:uncharacterized protein LOC128207213 [Mya arenaria]|uniref:uncharacterized protein LOC128207213 n=1 Tax=Mya arenaria TaxID=6604 RepID=UPI0022DFDF25|nr:uncharacterized protein LOC128207213 [Mya arenaria]XP_052765972.1 uncharacterized protein LOC128207213 [Mya arenaria]
MGNASGLMKNRGTQRPRVVLESPEASSTDTRQTRVTFANARKLGSETLKARPQMTDIGNMQSETYRNNEKVQFKRSQSTRIGSNADVSDSITSVRSSASGPVDGIWEPTLDPYTQAGSRERSAVNPEYSEPYHYMDRNNSYNQYRGFRENDYAYSHSVQNGLARVDEI